jgi:hypothetical protein
LAFLLASSWGRYSLSRGLESLVRLTPGSFMFIWHHPHEADKASWSLQCLLLLVLRVHSQRVLSVSAFDVTASDLRLGEAASHAYAVCPMVEKHADSLSLRAYQP